ncbi:hypothetical protein Pvag_pPag20035 (plasmid) [Pantoea vagans C9-1]|nr:hypothetical protein Pvag_pPag20035 [Pantoea vagans C9-1]
MVTRQISRSAACFSAVFIPGYNPYKLHKGQDPARIRMIQGF